MARAKSAMRPPKDLDRYTSRDEAAQFLLAQAFRLLDMPAKHQIRLRLNYSFWNEDWTDPSLEKPKFIVRQVTTETKE